MDDYISREEHKEFCKRMEDEHNRMNHRINALEGIVTQIQSLAISVEKIALSTKDIEENQKALKIDVEEIKKRDGEMWRKVTGYVCTAIIGIVVGYIFKQIGM